MSSKSKDKDPKAKENCVTFEPQAWRRHVCKNCFRTRDAHNKKEANGSAVKPKDNGTASSISSKLSASTSPTTSPKQDHKSKETEASCKSPTLPAKKKGGLLSKLTKKGSGEEETSNGAKKVKGQSGKSGNKKSEETVGSPEVLKKKATSTVSPPPTKKSPLSPSSAKKTRAFSPPVRKSPSPLSPPTSKKTTARSSKAEGSDKSKSAKGGKGNGDKQDSVSQTEKNKQHKLNSGKGKKGKKGATEKAIKEDDVARDKQDTAKDDVNIGEGVEEVTVAETKINPELLVETVSGGDNIQSTGDETLECLNQGKDNPAEIQDSEPSKDSQHTDTNTVLLPSTPNVQSEEQLQLPLEGGEHTHVSDIDISEKCDENVKVDEPHTQAVGDISEDDTKHIIECTASGEALDQETIHQGSETFQSPTEVSTSGEPSEAYPSSALPQGALHKEQEEPSCGTDKSKVDEPSASSETNVADGEDRQLSSTQVKQGADGLSGEDTNTTGANGVLDPCPVAISTDEVSAGGIGAEGEKQVQGVAGQVECRGEQDFGTVTQGGNSQQSQQQGGQEDNNVTLSDPPQPPLSCLASAEPSAETQIQAIQVTTGNQVATPEASSLSAISTDTEASTDITEETSSSSLSSVTEPKGQIASEDLSAKGETFTPNQVKPETTSATNEQEKKSDAGILEVEATGEASPQQQELIVSEQGKLTSEATVLSGGKQNTITDALLQTQTTTENVVAKPENISEKRETQGELKTELSAEGAFGTSEEQPVQTGIQNTGQDKLTDKEEQGLKQEPLPSDKTQEAGQEVAVTGEHSEASILPTEATEGTTSTTNDEGSLLSTGTSEGIASQPDTVATEVVFITGSGVSVDGDIQPQRRASDAILHQCSEIAIVEESCDLETAEDILYEKGSTEGDSENGSDISDLSARQQISELEGIQEEENQPAVETSSQVSQDLVPEQKEEKSDVADSSATTDHKSDLSSTGGENTRPGTCSLPEPPLEVSVDQEAVVTSSELQGALEETTAKEIPARISPGAPAPSQLKGEELGIGEKSLAESPDVPQKKEEPSDKNVEDDSDYNIIVLPAPEFPDGNSQDQGELLGYEEPGLLSPTSTRSLTESPDQWFEAETELPPPPAFSDTQTSKLVVCLSPAPGLSTDQSSTPVKDTKEKIKVRSHEGGKKGDGVRDLVSPHTTESFRAEPEARVSARAETSPAPGSEIQVNSESGKAEEVGGGAAAGGVQDSSQVYQDQAKSTSPVPDIYIEKQGSVAIATTTSDSSFIGEVKVLPGVNITAANLSNTTTAPAATTEATPVASDATGRVFGVGEGGKGGSVAGERRPQEEAGGVVVARGRRRKRRGGSLSHQQEQDQSSRSVPGVVIHETPPASSQPPAPGTPRPQEAGRKVPSFPTSTHSPAFTDKNTFQDTGEPIVRPSASLPHQSQEESTGSPAPTTQGQGLSPEVIVCEPVVASTFSRVSSPSSDLQVADATLSLRSPSASSPSASPSSLSPSSPTRSRSPQGAVVVSTDDNSTDQGQTCVSKVTSFVIQPKKEPEPPHDYDQTSYIFNNSNFYNQNDPEAATLSYGGYPSVEEDITTLATVNVKGKSKKKSKQQTSDFSPDNIPIARHRPRDGASFDNFDRTLQFTPTTSARVRRRRMSDAAYVREDNMMEGTRMLIDNLREKQHLLEEKCGRLEREKSALNDLLNVKKTDFLRIEEKCNTKISDLEILCSRLEAENNRLVERLKLPEAERTEIRDQEIELEELRRKLNEAEDVIGQLTEESTCLQSEIKDMHLEMDEMHDQFRDDEALEFRDLQKELEATAKNCRILQFKLRKVERRNDALQTDRLHMEEKIKVLESRWQNNNEQHQIRELEEELRMAKEVSVRLHDELEIVEERRVKFEDELERVQDLLRDSEKGRSVLQKEFNTTTEELELLRAQLANAGGSTTLEVPSAKPTLGKKGKEGSVEYDVEQLMRDLADSLEREHDLKGQLEHTEEETINLRKKVSDIEDENEVIQIQLQKMSSAKSGKYFPQKSTESLDDHAAEQESHELRLQLEMAEEEAIVLRRKLDDIDVENETLKREVRRLRLKLAGKDSKEIKDDEQEDTRTYDERISAMAQDIDDLKWKLIEKDQERPIKDEKDAENEAERTRAGEQRGMLKKSVSLDGQDAHSDMRRQLEVVIQDTALFRDKISTLEQEKETIETRNRALEESLNRSKIPVVTADDAAMKNIELQDKIKKLEADNQSLRDVIKKLDERTTALSKEVSKVHQAGESAETKEQLRRLEADVSSFQKTISELQDSNKKLADGLKGYESTDEGKTSRAQSSFTSGPSTNEDLVEIIKDLESENRHLQSKVKNREDENAKLEKEVNEYREDMDKMLDTFKERESDLQMELQSWENKNIVLSNLLELVTERAESIKSLKSEKSERSCSTVSDVTIGSDDVFGEKLDDFHDWNEKLICRIHSLENLLKEERTKVQSVEKRLLLKDGQQAALTDDMKIHEREKEILQQEQKIKQILEKEKLVIEEELTLCQRQLSETTEQSTSLRERLDKMQKVHDTLRQDFQKATAQLKEEKDKAKDYIKQIAAKDHELQTKAEEEKKRGSSKDAKFVGVGGIKEREPASWRWEKQEMERNVKELKKKVDDLHRQLSRQQVRVKLAGDDQKPRADQNKTKELEGEIKSLKEEAETRKADIAKMEATIQTVTSTLEFREEQWNAEREILDTDRLAVIKESTQKAEVIRSKDEIIKQKNALIQQKESALKERENSMLNYDQTLKEKDDSLESIRVKLNEITGELAKIREELKSKEDLLKDMEAKVKELNANVCARDGRIKEKDDIIENLNRTLSEKESSIEDMDNTIRKAMKSIDDKENEIKTLETNKNQLSGELTNTTTDLNNARYKSDDFERKLHSAEKEHGKEIASLVILREKMEAHISQLKTEKSLADGEVQDLKRVLMEKEDFFRQSRNDLEVELRNVKEKLHSLEGARLGSQGDKINKLQLENEDLFNEKTILVKEVKRLARELENAESEWNKEKKTYRKLMKEKEETAQDLRRKDPEDDSSTLEAGGATAMIESQQADIVQKAEQSGMEELYESKLRISAMQIKQIQDEVDELKKENAQLRDLLMSSQKNMSDLKHRYDVNASTWHDERATLERRALEADESRRQLDALQRVVQQLETQVRQMESERSELEVQMKEAVASRDAARQSLQAHINKTEEQSALTSSGKFKWSERQKRESAWEKERSDHQRALTEYQNLVRDLEAKLRTAARQRDTDYRDLVAKLETAKKSFDRDSNDLRKKSTQNEEKAKQVAGLQQTLIDLQYKLQSDREAWLRERTELQKQLRESEKSKLAEKEKTSQLISEVRKVKEMTPLLGQTGGVELEIRRKSDAPTSPSADPSQRSYPMYDLPPPGASEPVRTIPIRRLVDDPYDKPLLEALQHISQLAEDLNKTDIKREDRPKAPPAFRRSLSTSEVEDYREYIESAEQAEEAPVMMPHPPVQRQSGLFNDHPLTVAKPPAPPTPNLDSSYDDLLGPMNDMSGGHRSRSRRAQSVAVPDIQVTNVASRSSRPASARSSMYASGTQSAYSSRDASPERRFGVRKITPYPVAPPSFLITPSRTPRRVTASMDREIAMPEKHLQKLYDKLSAIEREQTDQEQLKQDRLRREGSVEAHHEAIDDRRQRGMRLLVKSMSVDSYRDDPSWMPLDAEKTHPNAHFCPKQLDTVFDDAPKSQTLPASIRVGETTIVPGQTELAMGGSNTPAVRRHAERARRQFYDNYSLEKGAYFSWPRKSRKDKYNELAERAMAESEDELEAEADHQPETATVAPIQMDKSATKEPQKEKQIVIPIGKHRKNKEKDEEKEKKESKFSYFFSSVRDRRKLFSKKSRSVDESPVRKSVMQAGLQAGRAAAPSTFEAPEKGKEVKETKEVKEATPRPSTLRERFHKRAASLDVTSLFSVSSHSNKGGEQPGTSGRRSSIGTGGTSSVRSDTPAGTSGSGKKDHSRDGTCRDPDPEVCTTTPTLTPKFPKPKTPPNRRLPTRWRTPSMEKARQRPIVFRNSDTDRFEVVVKRRSLSESNVVFLEHMQESQLWNSYTETRV